MSGEAAQTSAAIALRKARREQRAVDREAQTDYRVPRAEAKRARRAELRSFMVIATADGQAEARNRLHERARRASRRRNRR